MTLRRLDPRSVERLVGRASRSRVLVVGDVMVDEYVLGEVERTSPEAPVPVLRVVGSSNNLGGAANVARQLAAFGARVDLAGAIGDDDAGGRFSRLCAAASIDVRHVAVVGGRPTTCKQRAVRGGQQVLRIDWEDPTEHDASLGERLLAQLAAEPAPDLVVISDYAKGFVTPGLVRSLIEQARRRWEVPVLVDPKWPDFGRYRGATLVKANLVEFESAIGRRLGDEPERGIAGPARALLAAAGIDDLVVTLGARGMAVVAGGAEPVLLPQAVETVFDVSGAGDTVLAILALALLAGHDLVEAAQIANEAAGIVVRKTGVAVCAPDELEARLAGLPRRSDLDPRAVVQQVQRWRAGGSRVVFTNGCFDLLHAGHVHLLAEAAALGDVVVVGLNSDRSVAALKGPGRPCIPEQERAAVLASLPTVDAVVIFDDDDPADLIGRIEPDVLVKGADYELTDIVGRDAVEARGGRVVRVPLLPGWSTTSLIAAVRDQAPS